MVSRLAAAEAVDSPLPLYYYERGRRSTLSFTPLVCVHIPNSVPRDRTETRGVLILSLLPKLDPHCWGRQSVKHKSSNKCIYALHDQRQLCIVVQVTSINQYFNNNICDLAPSSSSLHISMRISAAPNWCS